MRFFVDLNIFLDVLLIREPHFKFSRLVMDWSDGQDVWMAWHSLATLDYVGNKLAGKPKTNRFIVRLLEIFEISPTDTRSARFARMLPMTDFEDALQVAAADMVKADFILTRNLKDYKKSPIPAMAPEEFVERFV